MNITIRNWNESDIDNLARRANNKKIADFLRNIFPNPYTIEDAASFIRYSNHAETTDLLLAIDQDGEAVGGISLTFKNDVSCKTAEIGYWLGEDSWGRGIAPKAVKLICDKGFAEYDIVRIEGEVFSNNINSIKVLEKCGFQHEGILRKSIYKNDTFYDSLIYALIKEDKQY